MRRTAVAAEKEAKVFQAEGCIPGFIEAPCAHHLPGTALKLYGAQNPFLSDVCFKNALDSS